MSQLTVDTVATYIIKIQLNFENAYVTATERDKLLLISSWYDALCEYPKEICDKAVNNALKRAKFAPRLGDITEEIEKLLSVDKKSDEQLWAELTSVLGNVYDVSRYLVYSQHNKWATDRLESIYSILSEELKLFVVNTSTLVELAEMSAENLRYEKARFFKQMPALKSQNADKAAAQKFLAQVEAMQALPQNTQQLPLPEAQNKRPKK